MTGRHALVILSISLATAVHGANILFFFGCGTYSHKIGIWPLVSALADRGHNVTLLSPFTKQPFKNTKVTDVAPEQLAEKVDSLLEADRQKGTDNDIWKQVPKFTVQFCETIVNLSFDDEVTKSTLYGVKYDLIITNSILSECGAIWALYHNTKLAISVSTSAYPWIADVHGFPVEASWLPDLTLQHMSFPMTFFDRVRNYYKTLYLYYLRYYESYPEVRKLAQRVLNTSTEPDILAAERNASLILMNVYYGAEFGRALPPFVIPVGGMQCWQPQKKLSVEMQKILDNAQDGAIMISFGSSVEISNASKRYADMFFEAIHQFPKIQFLWKWAGPIPGNAPSNLHFSGWLPQMEILQHPNLLTFITHCGLNSKMEATCSGVPVIAMPLFAEQDYNAYHVSIYKLGVTIEAKDLTSQTITDAIKEVTTNKIYKENMKKAQQIFRDRYLNPVDTAVFWTEFVLRNDDTSFLKPLNYHQYWWQRRMLDVHTFFFLVAAAIIIAVLYLTKTIASFMYACFLRKAAHTGLHEDGKRKTS